MLHRRSYSCRLHILSYKGQRRYRYTQTRTAMVDRRFEGRPTILQNEHRIKNWQLQIRCVCFKRSTTSHWAKLSRKTNVCQGELDVGCALRGRNAAACCASTRFAQREGRRVYCRISYYVEGHNYRGKDSKVHAPVASLQNRDGAHRVLPFRLAKHRARNAVWFGESHGGVKLCVLPQAGTGLQKSRKSAVLRAHGTCDK